MVTVHEGIRLTYGDEPFQFGDLYVPEDGERHPVVILIHGGFWRATYDLSLMTKLAQELVAKGIATWNIEFRRVGNNGGGWPGTLLDVAQASDYLMSIADDYKFDLQRVVAVGHSAGGHLALWLGTRNSLAKKNELANSETPLKLRGAVSLAGAMDLEHVWRLGLGNDAVAEFLNGSPEKVPERYAAASPLEHLPLGIEQVLIHGTEDDRVPLIVSQEYADRARSLGDTVKLIKLVGANHFVVIDPTAAAWSRVVDEIKRLMR
ncbi:MAG: alpha/beta hydrolase [Ktedonobacteraceae bacterium]|nr:alpha/beta hydrolase [Ktedonobacteraceae bacterium]MBV9713335.1 alpha/beta hydrolase [Ktedonobacteraceae bacterium]